MLALPGFIEAHNFEPKATEDGRTVHTVQYVLNNRQALDQYLENDAERMRAPALSRFGDALRSSRDIRTVETVGDNAATTCLNCAVDITGQFCWNCGQRGNTRLISLFELLKDAFGDLFEMDSRLWRTLAPLFTRPGFLTAEYLRGRRARYMPPFRMYLVLSFLFFLLTTAFSDNNSVIDESALEIDETSIEDNEDEQKLTAFNLSEDGFTLGFASDGYPPSEAPPDQNPEAPLAKDSNLDKPTEDNAAPDSTTDAEGVLSTDDSGDTGDTNTDANTENSEDSEDSEEDAFSCEIDFGGLGLTWLDNMITERRIEAICKHVEQDNGQRMLERFTQNLAVGAMAMLPLLALILKLLYPLSRRYYVEHLLFLVHYHSFLFLTASILILYNRLLGLISVPGWVQVIPNVILGIYLPVYLYKALRRVYQQGRFVTSFKYLLLFASYLMAVLFIVLAMAVYIIMTY